MYVTSCIDTLSGQCQLGELIGPVYFIIMSSQKTLAVLPVFLLTCPDAQKNLLSSYEKE